MASKISKVPAIVIDSPQPIREFLTPAEVAAQLGVEPTTILAWSRRDKNPLPARRLTPKIYRYVWSEVREWIEAGGTLRRKRAA